MSNRMISLLEREARVRHLIETRSQKSASSDLQLLRLRRLSLLIRRHLEDCVEMVVPACPAVALARAHPLRIAKR